MKALLVIISLGVLLFSGTCTSCTKWKKDINLEVDVSEFMNSIKESLKEEYESWSTDPRLGDRKLKRKIYFNVYRQVPMFYKEKVAA